MKPTPLFAGTPARGQNVAQPDKFSSTMRLDWHIGDVIAKLRKSTTRLNQTALAKKVGVNKATIVRAENGDVKVSRDTYWKICAALNTTLADLEAEAARLATYPTPPTEQRSKRTA
jgi:DNA-binding XRE family transcriptional regulator